MKKAMRNEMTALLGITAATCALLGKKKLAAGLACSAGAVYFGAIKSLPLGANSFVGQSVVITGGSRGLGLALAKRLASEGARLTLIARDADELMRAEQIIHRSSPGTQILSVPCDLTEPDALLRAFHKVEATFKGVDMLINNAGAISVGPFESMEQEDFEAQMKLHLYAVIESVKIALPYLYESNGRRIVNICSMGGKVAVPHMLPYDASKFALSGFSQGLMAELAADDISVTTVYPTVMRTGSPIQAVFKGDHEREYAWFAIADVFPGLSLSADSAAKKIVEAARERRADFTPSLAGRAREIGAALFPEIFAAIMRRLALSMPKGQSHLRKTGADSRGLVEKSWLALPFSRRARVLEKELNQTSKSDAEFNLGIRH
ncbi:MAG: SDR family NAD(P)-dependent oxidoreductase [Bdellovibrionota bacterium]